MIPAVRVARFALLVAAHATIAVRAAEAAGASDAAGAGAPADASLPDLSQSSPDFQADLRALRQDLAELRAQQAEGWLDAIRAEQVRGIVADVLRDSQVRSAFQGSGPGAQALSGYERGTGFFVATADGDFKLAVFGFTQARFVYNAGFDAAERTPYDASNVWGFESRRNEFFFSGNALDRSLQFLLGISYGSQPDPAYMPAANGNPAVAEGNTFSLGYLSVTKQLDAGWYLQAGSIFTPWTFQSHLFSAAQTQMGEYSPLEYAFGAAYTTGVSIGYAGDAVNWQACYGDAIGLAPSGWNADSNQGVSLSGRLNWKLAGTWEQFATETSFPGQPFGAFVGVAARLQAGRAINPAALAVSGQLGATADFSLMFGGANLIAQGVFIDNYLQNGTSAWGALLQGGFFVSGSVELFAGWTLLHALGTQQYGNFGANWYIDRDALKVTARVMVPGGGDEANFYAVFLPAQGLLDAAAPNNQVGVSLQLQLAF